MPPVFRFAPSPNGYLHLGHALSALLNADMAQAAGGRLLLRIEDIDETRCRPEYEAAISEDLAWLGHRLGKAGAAAIGALRRLSRRARQARGARADLSELREPRRDRRAGGGARAKALGRAIPTARRSIRAMRRRCRRRSAKSVWRRVEPYALRLDMQAAVARAGLLTWTETGAGPVGETGVISADPSAWGDVVLARKETPTSYHLAVVVDDAAQDVTDVVRGRDLFHATSVHRLLQALLGLPAPRYHHHRLVLDADGKKLSKSTSATGLRELRAKGDSPAEIRRLVGLD